MIRINLLPHRAEKRKRRKIQFAILSGLALGLGLFVVGLGYAYLSARIAFQETRNAYLNSEIAKLDKQIAEIKRLRQQVKALLARKEVVEKLQSTRSDVVHLMDQMLRILPQGVYLRTLKQTGNKVQITGYAQSSARVSTLMRAIDQSPWLDSPQLVQVQAAFLNKARTNQFAMSFMISKNPAPPPAPKPGTAGAASAPAASQPAKAKAASAPAATSAPAAASAPKTTQPAKAAQHSKSAHATPAHSKHKKR